MGLFENRVYKPKITWLILVDHHFPSSMAIWEAQPTLDSLLTPSVSCDTYYTTSQPAKKTTFSPPAR